MMLKSLVPNALRPIAKHLSRLVSKLASLATHLLRLFIKSPRKSRQPSRQAPSRPTIQSPNQPFTNDDPGPSTLPSTPPLNIATPPFTYDNPNTSTPPSETATPACVIDYRGFPHIYEAIRSHAPFSVELAFRAAFRAETKDLHPALSWPHRVILSRPAIEGSFNTPPEISGPNGELVIPAYPDDYNRRSYSYAEFARLVNRNSSRLKDVHILDIVNDVGSEGPGPVLYAVKRGRKPENARLHAIRFIPYRVAFPMRTWPINVRKVVLFIKVSLLSTNCPTGHGYPCSLLPWDHMLRLHKKSSVDTHVINLRFTDEDYPLAPKSSRYPKYYRPNTVLIFADALENIPGADLGRPKYYKASITQRESRFFELCWAIGRLHSRNPIDFYIRPVTVVGVDEVDPGMFALAPGTVARERIHEVIHSIRMFCQSRHRDCTPSTCPLMKFYTVEQYKALIGPAEFGVETAW